MWFGRSVFLTVPFIECYIYLQVCYTQTCDWMLCIFICCPLDRNEASSKPEVLYLPTSSGNVITSSKGWKLETKKFTRDED